MSGAHEHPSIEARLLALENEPGPEPEKVFPIYEDALNPMVDNWSWGVTLDFGSTEQVKVGERAVSVKYDSAWAGLYLHFNDPVSGYDYRELKFWIHGGLGGQRILVWAIDIYNNFVDAVEIAPPGGVYTEQVIKLSDIGNLSQIGGLVFQETAGGPQNTFYLDEIRYSSGEVPPPPPPPGAGPLLEVFAYEPSWPISDGIYGMSVPDRDFAAEVGLGASRFGGNATTRYDPNTEISNRAMDWFFENVKGDDGGNPPYTSSLAKFIEANIFATVDRHIVVMPMIGWRPADNKPAGHGFSVAKYGQQQATDPYRPDAGNGVKLDGTFVTGNDPADTSVPADESFAASVAEFLFDEYGFSPLYELDNEPDLWHLTHRDVHPVHVGYDELWERTKRYASALKAVDPECEVAGPISWGWTGYFYSALDTAPGGSWWENPLDRRAHGDVPLVEWYLQQLKNHETATGQRLVDYLDLHFYPQAPGVALGGAGSDETKALRLRSTKALWDPHYTDESWINEPVRLIPRMREWVDVHYPGTKLAISEYNWGGMEDINGALALADVLGIFGQLKVDIACLWGAPAADQPWAYAFRMYRNYDGDASAFGDNAVAAVSADQDALSVYAATESYTGYLTVMVINKSRQGLTSTVRLHGMIGGTGLVYRYSPEDIHAIVRAADQPIGADGSFEATFPADSITLFALDLLTSWAPGEELAGLDGEHTHDDLAAGIADINGRVDDIYTRIANLERRVTRLEKRVRAQ